MGLSSKKQSAGPSKQALPYIQQASTAVQGAYNANQPNLQMIGDRLTGAFGDFADGIGSGARGAADYYRGVLSGPGSNPELGNIIDTTNASVADQINAMFSRAGQTGSSRQIGELGKRLSENESALRYNDWNNEQQRKAAAAAGLAGTDSSLASSYGALTALGDSAATTPYLGANFLSQNLGHLWGNATTSTSTPSTAKQIGDGLKIAATIFSDRRLKTGIRKLGEMADGLGVYAYRYVWGGPEQRGVMADEVASLRPWALGPTVEGFATVNYGAL